MPAARAAGYDSRTMIRLLHLADVHLGASLSAFGGLAAERRAAVLHAFRKLPDIADDAAAHAVVIAGDLFDGPAPSREDAAAAREAVRRVVESGRPVFAIPGNHDASTLTPNPYREPLGGAHVFTEPVFGEPVTAHTEGGPLHVYGIAFDAAREADPLSTFRRVDLDGIHVVLLHGPFPDAPHWATSGNALRLEPEHLRRLDADYIALGDYHRFRPPSEFAEDGSLPACYAGSFAAVDLDEVGARGCVLARLEPDSPARIEHIAVPLPQVLDLGSFDVSGYSGEVEIAGAVADVVAAHSPPASPGGRSNSDGADPEAERPIPKITLTGNPDFPLEAEKVEAELIERFGHAKVNDESRYFASSRLDDLADQDTVVGHAVRLGRRRIRESEGDDRRVAERALRIALSELGVQ